MIHEHGRPLSEPAAGLPRSSHDPRPERTTMTNDQTPAVEVLARLLCAADVHVHDGDHPSWQQLRVAQHGRGQDDYRKAARWLLPRMTVATKPAVVPVPLSTQADRRAQLLDALDFAYCQGLGFDTPEALLVAYDASRAVPVPPPADRAALRDRIAAAMREHYLCTNRDEADADGNLPCRCGDWREPGIEVDDENDWDSHLADAVLAVLPEPTDQTAEIKRMREQHKASLRRADQINNELMEEVQRYAAGKERPVLWSVYNRMHGRALEAEAKWKRLTADRDALEHARRITATLAAHAAGFQDVLDDSDRDPWARMVREDIAALRSAIAEPSPSAEESGCEAEAELYVLLRKAGEPRHEAQALIDRHRAEVLHRAELRRVAAEEQPAKPDRCPHGCDTSICPCLACEADEAQPAETEPLDTAEIQAAALRTAATELWHQTTGLTEYGRGARWAVGELRRKADEVQAAVGEQPETQKTPVRPCNYWTHTGTEHTPHRWVPQPGMDPVHCPGYDKSPE